MCALTTCRTGCLIELQSNTTFFTRHTHRSRPGPDLVPTSVQTQPNQPKWSRLPEKLKFQPWGRSAAGRRRNGRGGAPGPRAAVGRPREAERPCLGRSCA